ncbi:MAG: hypothetical protein ACK5JF_02655 [Oscillospiraceae bacterium]
MPKVNTPRGFVVNTNGPPLDIDGTAALLAWFITDGDASAYLAKIREIQRKRAESGVPDASK